MPLPLVPKHMTLRVGILGLGLIGGCLALGIKARRLGEVVAYARRTETLKQAQALGMIDQGLLVYFMTLDKTRFRQLVEPGDVLELHVQILRGRGKIWKFWGEGKVRGETVAEAEYSAMIITQDDERRRGAAS